MNAQPQRKGSEWGTGTEEDPVGFLGTEAFPCPPFLVWREQTSVSLMFLEFQWPKSKQLAIREERGHRDKGGAAKKQWCRLRAGSWSYLKGYTVSLSSLQN